jgi:hypothetical protein
VGWRGLAYAASEKPVTECHYFVELFTNVFADLEVKYPHLSKSLRRDHETLVNRLAKEGWSFVTTCLPRLGKAVIRSLETGKLCRVDGFRRMRDRAIPAFGSGMLSCLFTDDGDLKQDSDRVLLRDLICLLFLAYKAEVRSKERLNQLAIARFQANDAELADLCLDPDDDVLRRAKEVIRCVFEGFDPKDIAPRHGPGAVATAERGNQKWTFSRLYRELHQYYPYYDYFMVAGERSLRDNRDWYMGLKRVPSGTSKVVLVPKDSRGPRVISMEPLEYQFVQQGLSRSLTRWIQNHRLTKGQVNFKKQCVNADLALVSSLTREYATLDLKDASDRVSTVLVKELFGSSDELLKALLATRSHATTLPSGEVVALNKFAPMGSALCFPIEAMCFYALSVACLGDRGVRNPHTRVYVYGDDILVPREHAHAVMDCLERYGLLVNREKSFIEGHFRESCGMDAWKGFQITPLRLKAVPTVGKPFTSDFLANAVALANSFVSRGWLRTSEFLFKMVESALGKLPYGTAKAGYLCREVHSAFKALILNLSKGYKCRWNDRSQQAQIKGWGIRCPSETQPIDGWSRCLRSLLVSTDSDPSEVVLPRNTQIPAPSANVIPTGASVG